MNISNAQLIYSGLLRDGGSAVILLKNGEQNVRLRYMGALSEQKSPDFGKIEVLADEELVGIFENAQLISGFDVLNKNICDKLSEKVSELFGIG